MSLAILEFKSGKGLRLEALVIKYESRHIGI